MFAAYELTPLFTIQSFYHWWEVKLAYECKNGAKSHQVPGAVRSSQVTLDVWVKDLDCRLDETTARKMLLVLNERQPRLQQLVVGLHINHVILIQLSTERKNKIIILLSLSQLRIWQDLNFVVDKENCSWETTVSRQHYKLYLNSVSTVRFLRSRWRCYYSPPPLGRHCVQTSRWEAWGSWWRMWRGRWAVPLKYFEGTW